ncbi:hypothetical protein K1T71_005697 [Dendrolimus kikuchii]|uniref:Uncharacterized protein n=1 Tax=Dendrolimus kikuchii TaxID=765133 RepID=A0ACC1D4Z0_9NEOP|nr:hypothetical protein K1T71_005697 [Dendrolimus kikuchii]
MEQDWHISSYDVAGELGIDHKTVLAHLKKAGYTKKLDIWVPHELTERNLMNRVLICDSLLRRNETEPFLKKLITGDEKWIMYDKKVRKRSPDEIATLLHSLYIIIYIENLRICMPHFQQTRFALSILLLCEPPGDECSVAVDWWRGKLLFPCFFSDSPLPSPGHRIALATSNAII